MCIFFCYSGGGVLCYYPPPPTKDKSAYVRTCSTSFCTSISLYRFFLSFFIQCKILCQAYFIIIFIAIGSCEAGWTLNRDHCYYLVNSAAFFDEAEADCVSKGGHVTSVNDQEEQSFLSSESKSQNRTINVSSRNN